MCGTILSVLIEEKLKELKQQECWTHPESRQIFKQNQYVCNYRSRAVYTFRVEIVYLSLNNNHMYLQCLLNMREILKKSKIMYPQLGDCVEISIDNSPITTLKRPPTNQFSTRPILLTRTNCIYRPSASPRYPILSYEDLEKRNYLRSFICLASYFIQSSCVFRVWTVSASCQA